MKTKRNKRVEQKRLASSRIHASYKLRRKRTGPLRALRFSVTGYLNKHRRRPAFVDALLEQDEAVRAERMRRLEAAFGIPVMTEEYAMVEEASNGTQSSLSSLADGRTDYGSVMASQRIRRRII